MKKPNTSAPRCLVLRAPRLAAFATLCLAVGATTVRAADMPFDSVPPQRVVSFGDLNLANPQGVEQLYRRIAGAAQQVCSGMNGGSLQEKQRFSICAGQSIARAVAAVNQPALTALQATKTGLRPAAAQLAAR